MKIVEFNMICLWILIIEGAKAIIKFGFRELNLHRIFATCDPDNFGSAKVLQKIGMIKEGCLRENKLQKGQWRDSLVYSILEQECRTVMVK